MVWKQDLAKLKQHLKEDGAPKSKPQVVKPVAKPQPPGSMEDEDALFLSAMGQRKPAPAIPQEPPGAAEAPPVQPPPAAESGDFTAAMGGLKGLKPMPAKGIAPSPKPLAPAPQPPPAPTPLPVIDATLVVPAPVSSPEPAAAGPVLIHLAAGMAIEVDGSLDLRGHTTTDAIERLRERIQDGVFLGWRTFHVTLGTSPELREAFLAFLGTSEARVIARYAQAPIPMGGSQAWIVYFAAPAAH